MKQFFEIFRGIGTLFHALLIASAIILTIASESLLRSTYEIIARCTINPASVLSYPHILFYFFLFCFWYVCILGFAIYLII